MKKNKEILEYINEVIDSMTDISTDKKVVKNLVQNLLNKQNKLDSDFISELLKIYKK